MRDQRGEMRDQRGERREERGGMFTKYIVPFGRWKCIYHFEAIINGQTLTGTVQEVKS